MTSDIIDESEEICEDPYGDADKDETLPELREEEAGQKPVQRRMAVPEQKDGMQVQTSSRQRYEATLLHNDSLRKKYDIRRRVK